MVWSQCLLLSFLGFKPCSRLTTLTRKLPRQVRVIWEVTKVLTLQASLKIEFAQGNVQEPFDLGSAIKKHLMSKCTFVKNLGSQINWSLTYEVFHTLYGKGLSTSILRGANLYFFSHLCLSISIYKALQSTFQVLKLLTVNCTITIS